MLSLESLLQLKRFKEVWIYYRHPVNELVTNPTLYFPRVIQMFKTKCHANIYVKKPPNEKLFVQRWKDKENILIWTFSTRFHEPTNNSNTLDRGRGHYIWPKKKTFHMNFSLHEKGERYQRHKVK